MGILERAIKRGISEGVNKAVGDAVEKVVAPKAEEYANKTAAKIDEATQQMTGQNAQASAASEEAGSSLTGVFANLQKSMEGYATEVSKSLKICPACGQPADADKKFCPKCGAKLPDSTIAEGAVCPKCGKQNSIGTQFCAECGTKLPSAVAEEKAAQKKDEEVLAGWDKYLAAYPKWNCGGSGYEIEQMDGGVSFMVKMESEGAAKEAVKKYRQLLIQNGFRQAGEYPDVCHLYKMTDGVCYHLDTEHCFDGDYDQPQFLFSIGEPTGGFNYTKPEPEKASSILDLFK